MPTKQRKQTAAGAHAAPANGQDPILAALGDLGQATARQIAEHCTSAYSTVTAGLRRLKAAGRVEQTTDGRMATWRLAGPAATGTGKPAPRAATKADNGARAGDPAPATEPPAAGGGRPGATTRRPGKQPAATRAAAGAPGGRPRRGRGQLRKQVLAVMQTHPDETWTVTRLSKALDGASPGAVVLAARKLVATGHAKEVTTRPATFQAE